MGCFGSKEAPSANLIYKYSYEQGVIASSLSRSEISDTSLFLVSKRTDETVCRPPGSIGGQSFAIEDCTNCNVFLTDHLASITIDECRNCRFFVGPTAGAVFLRNCTNCTCVVASQQFRTRDCKDCTVLLYAANRPIIEETRNMKLGCFVFFYFNLRAQFNAAKLSIFNNTWSQVYDFTPSQSEVSCTLLTKDEARTVAESFITLASADPQHFSAEEVDIGSQVSVVPYTHGKVARSDWGESVSCFVLMRPEWASDAVHLVDRFGQREGFKLLRTREVILSADQFRQITGFAAFKGEKQNQQKWLEGPCVGVEFLAPSKDIVIQELAVVVGTERVHSLPIDYHSEANDFFFEQLPEAV